MNLPSELRRIARQLDFTEDDKTIVLLAAKVLRMDREPLAVLNLITAANKAADAMALGPPPDAQVPTVFLSKMVAFSKHLREAVKAVEGEWNG